MAKQFLDLQDFYDLETGFKTSSERLDEILDYMELTRDNQWNEFEVGIIDWAYDMVEPMFGDRKDPNGWLGFFNHENLLILEKNKVFQNYEKRQYTQQKLGVLEHLQDAYALFFDNYARENWNYSTMPEQKTRYYEIVINNVSVGKMALSEKAMSELNITENEEFQYDLCPGWFVGTLESMMRDDFSNKSKVVEKEMM